MVAPSNLTKPNRSRVIQKNHLALWLNQKVSMNTNPASRCRSALDWAERQRKNSVYNGYCPPHTGKKPDQLFS
jgi:hypothetical protein